ncbi:DUF3102 domain-containing protein [Phormidium sp. LEGE 05292]|uniref:DUF3102 domain-containing protein n=1 Tax=[Phormidium] sp. LEGE 05292 TaxID=767427 RepID=UPI001881931E|nr:DUF3102 domain-containing protein [Phormidium sp. LEGE 05292]MBE9226967.1 DUF3102 domain-containing protein [Phormidium sp. LEGE 05292]
MPASAQSSLQKVFDYTMLDAETSLFIQKQTGEIRALMKRTAQDIIEIGQKLILVKEKLAHGRFLDWIAAEFEWSYPTAARFMQVANSFSKTYQIDRFAASALYVLAAPSTPASARSEAIARAEAGEPITYTIAKEIRQKHTLPGNKSKTESVQTIQTIQTVQTVSPLKAVPVILPANESRPRVEIVATRPAKEAVRVLKKEKEAELPEIKRVIPISVTPSTTITIASQPISQPSSTVVKRESTGIWWQLGRRHLLYCGDPNSAEFTQKVPHHAGLLLGFPASKDWQSAIPAENRIIVTKNLPQSKDVRLFEDTLESIILLYTELGETITVCFLPYPEILSTINRLDRLAIFAEPDPKRVNEIITDWKAGGLKAEKIDF